jgi:3-oxoacyl-[acyl-carrier protein] reductase
MTTINRTAIVTGAGQGIGKGIAEAMAKAGYRVVVSDINEAEAKQVAEELKIAGASAMAVKCDVSNQAQVKQMFESAVKEFGGVEVLVNNAGIYPYMPFEQMSEEDWDKVMNINLKSVFLCSQAGAKIMPEGGRIINISSIASMVGFNNLVHYCASKGGINAMVRALALELAPKKITVNAVAPGIIMTPSVSQGMSEEVLKQTLMMIPAGRMGLPADIANAVVFLASEKSDYITGQVIVVDGGWTLR